MGFCSSTKGQEHPAPFAIYLQNGYLFVKGNQYFLSTADLLSIRSISLRQQTYTFPVLLDIEADGECYVIELERNQVNNQTTFNNVVAYELH